MQNLDIQLLTGTIVIVAPHMDDEALACGGLIAMLPKKEYIHIIYATDGMKSPAPMATGRDQISPELGKIRIQESIKAMEILGVPEQNLHFLYLPDAELSNHLLSLRDMLRQEIKRIAPQYICVPFRYDKHPDHLAINHVLVSDIEQGVIQTKLIEYFVYYRSRLLAKRDIRKYVNPQFLFKLDIEEVANQKRRALDYYTSQTTIYYSWQTRPVLTTTLLDEECQNPEYFLIAPITASGTAIFSGSTLWIRLAHCLEPILVRWKYLTSTFSNRIFQNHVRKSD